MSNSSPIILLVGGAGSGKDTVAEFIAKAIPDTTVIAQADPMKRFGRDFFGFTDEQLWGPSEMRNAVDPRFASKAEAELVMSRIVSMGPGGGLDWVGEVLPNRSSSQENAAYTKLYVWAQNTLQYGLDNGGLSARYVLQTLGTEWGRFVFQNVWTQYAAEKAWKMLGGGYAYSRTAGLVDAADQNTGLVVVTDGRFRNEVLNFRRQGAFIIRIRSPKVVTLEAGVKNHQSETELLTIPSHWFNVELFNDKNHGLAALELLVAEMVNEYLNHDQRHTTLFA